MNVSVWYILIKNTYVLVVRSSTKRHCDCQASAKLVDLPKSEPKTSTSLTVHLHTSRAVQLTETHIHTRTGAHPRLTQGSPTLYKQHNEHGYVTASATLRTVCGHIKYNHPFGPAGATFPPRRKARVLNLAILANCPIFAKKLYPHIFELILQNR